MKKLAGLISVLVLLNSCTKEIAGPPGAVGAPGNANVNSKVYTGLQWIKNGTEYDLTINAGNVTQDILDKGTVLVYMTTDNGATWIDIPITINNITIAYFFSVGKIVVSANSTTTPGFSTWKVVTISGQ